MSIYTEEIVNRLLDTYDPAALDLALDRLILVVMSEPEEEPEDLGDRWDGLE